LELPKADMAGDLKHRIEHLALGRTPTKAARTSTVSVLDAKEVERKQRKKMIFGRRTFFCEAILMAAK
jgi:hypothetical protein